MSDITLSNGREITLDLSSLTLREYRALFDPKQKQGDEDALLIRVSGLTQDEYLDLSYTDWKRMLVAFFKKSREPMTDPN